MKKFLVIILALAMLFGLAVETATVGMTGGYTDPDTGEFVDGEIVIDNPYAALWVEFFEDGRYPDDFAGVWVEGGGAAYVFGLVEGTDASKYEAVLGDYAGRYRFEYLPYSYNTLVHMRDVVWERLVDIMSAAGISEDENKIYFDVRVGEEEENGRIAQAMLDIKNEEGLPDGIENAFAVEYGIYIDTADEEIANEEADEAEKSPNTGLIYAVLPIAAAIAAIVIFRKRH